ncbi:MAG: lipid kinase, partial [Candidatus Electrothrix sp. AR4]|nr:lipid kinase [Candidatus Electrothrix sp. AR4]
IKKKGSKVADLKGRKITLVELSVSHYLLARALDMNGMSERDVKLINTGDADIAAIFTTDPNGAAVTWNPPLMQALRAPGAVRIFDSSDIPGEIIDLMVVRTDAPESLKKALVGAWYEVMEIMETKGPKREKAIASMAQASGGTVEEFKQQLATTSLFYKAADAVAFTASTKPKETMEQVRQFSYKKGLYGESAPSADLVGIAFDDGSLLGDKNNIKLRFTTKYMQ